MFTRSGNQRSLGNFSTIVISIGIMAIGIVIAVSMAKAAWYQQSYDQTVQTIMGSGQQIEEITASKELVRK